MPSSELKIMKFSKIIIVIWSLLIPSITFALNTQFTPVEKKVKSIEKRLSAQVGVTILNVETGDNWNYKGDDTFPLTSTFKTIACAKLLYDNDHKIVDIESTVKIKEIDLMEYSPVMKNYIGQQITLKQVCQAAMYMSDNTAANIIIKAVDGTQSITDFVSDIGDKNTRLDRIEPYLNEALLDDPRDTTTPNAISNTLKKLLFSSILSDSSKNQLKEWMINNQVTGNLLRSVLPDNWEIADRSGAGGFGARSITAVVWLQNQSPIIISIYISQTDASMDERNQAIVEIGKTIFDSYISN